jgi:hypothetical protein
MTGGHSCFQWNKKQLGMIGRLALHQLPDRFADGQDRNRPAREVAKFVPVVNAEVLVDGGQQILRRQRPLPGIFPAAAGGADNLATWCGAITLASFPSRRGMNTAKKLP